MGASAALETCECGNAFDPLFSARNERTGTSKIKRHSYCLECRRYDVQTQHAQMPPNDDEHYTERLARERV